MRLTPTEGKKARRALAEAGKTMADVARLARTAYRTAQFWYDGDKSSPRTYMAHRTLTGHDPAAERAARAAERDERKKVPA
jgi:hypothetical protein